MDLLIMIIGVAPALRPITLSFDTIINTDNSLSSVSVCVLIFMVHFMRTTRKGVGFVWRGKLKSQAGVWVEQEEEEDRGSDLLKLFRVTMAWL